MSKTHQAELMYYKKKKNYCLLAISAIPLINKLKC